MKASATITSAVLASLISFSVPAFSDEPIPEVFSEQQTLDEEAQYSQLVEQFWKSLHPQTGVIHLSEGNVTLTVPENYYYLNPQDSERVLVDAWGNPPGSAVLGMLFPAGSTPLDANTWGVTIEYQEDGWVSDEDANEIDYSELLDSMKKDAVKMSTERVKQGYEAIELVGWAATPYYDQPSHKMHWAKELHFGRQEAGDPNTMNYDIRVLGRKGVLVMSFIADMDQKQTIDMHMNDVLEMAEFDEGSRYNDFNPELDKVAAYGLGALVAGKLVAKTGLLAAGLIFLKKFGMLALVGIGALGRKLFSRRAA